MRERTTKPTTPEERARWRDLIAIKECGALPDADVLRLLDDIEERDALLRRVRTEWSGCFSADTDKQLREDIRAILGDPSADDIRALLSTGEPGVDAL